MRRDEVDARVRLAPVALVEIAGAGEPVPQLRGDPLRPVPEAADGVAVAPVPLRPQDREVADLVAPLAQVPRLGDELGAREHGVLVDDVEEGGELVDVVEVARQRRGEIEAEPVHVHLHGPVAQAVHDQLERLRVPDVERVAAARVVDVEARIARIEPVIAAVVDAAQAQRRPPVVPLGGVVVDHVEDHLDAGAVELLHHLLELVDLAAEAPGRSAGRVAPGRREVADRGVAPVVGEPARHDLRLVRDLVHGQELDGGDPQLEQVADGGLGPQARVRAAELGRDVGVARGEALDVDLVEHRVAEGAPRELVVVPEEEVVHDHALGRAGRVVPRIRRLVAHVGLDEAPHRRAPVDLVGDGARVGIEEDLPGVEAEPAPRLVRAVHAEAVELPRCEPGHEAVEHVGGELGQGQRLALGDAGGPVEQADVDPARVLGEDGEVDAGAVVRRAERVRSSRPDSRGGARHRVGACLSFLPAKGRQSAARERRFARNARDAREARHEYPTQPAGSPGSPSPSSRCAAPGRGASARLATSPRSPAG